MAEELVAPAEEFGREIRYAREARGWTQEMLASKLWVQQPYVSKVERGQQLASPQFAEQCDKAFGTPGVYARMRQRAADAGNPVWFIPYLRLERESVSICDYSNAFVMGMLQTPEYAEAVYRSARPKESAAGIKRLVDERMRRRELFEAPDPPSLWVILHEAVLRSRVGSARIMQRQLRHLLAASEVPGISLQVFPFQAGAPARGVAFNVLTRQNGAEVLYEETYQQGRVDDSVEAVAEARAAYERLRAGALSPAESLNLITHVMEAYTHEHHSRPLSHGMGEVQLQPRERRSMRRVGPRVHIRRRHTRPGQ
ncbi:helix-turn-helix domain-containing protein [Streptomyces luteireticuli]